MERPIRSRSASATRAPVFRFLVVVVFALGLGLGADGLARAGEVVITTPTAIACDDTSLDGLDVIVDGTIVFLDCEHAFASLTLRNSALVTPSPGQLAGMTLDIAGDLRIDATSAIDALGTGYAPGEGPGAEPDGGEGGDGAGSGGAGHGGRGGHGGATEAGGAAVLGGGSYGVFDDPGIAGSGGGDPDEGGRGGGVVRLFVGGTAVVDGVVSVDGQAAIRDGGGGSGGSLVLRCSRLEGAGVLRANGGAGGTGLGGGGGGGRLVVAGVTGSFEGSLEAFGGAPGTGDGAGDAAGQGGGAGTMRVERTGFRPRLLVDNGGQVGARTDFAGRVRVAGDLVASGGARLAHPPRDGFLTLSVDGDLTIEGDAAIDLNGLGHPAGRGLGAGEAAEPGSGGGGGGAGHGGAGGASAEGAGGDGAAGGSAYGESVAALELGSGGGLGDDPGSDAGGSAGAGAGGGSIRLEIGGRLALEGGIRADGAHAPAGTNGGGGSGGAIRIRCSDVVGGGFVRAHGGAGSGTGGGGGGGRVAIYAPCDAPVQFRGTVSVDGGPGSAGSDGADGSRFVSSLGTADCDEDGVPDACAIAAGDVPDRNGNGVPDPCEITLTLTVDPLIGGARSEATVAGGSPDTGVIVAWGFEDGRLDRRIGSWCSDFWFEIPDANPKSRIALQSTFDARGSYRGDFRVPPSLVGRRIRFQATQGRTCPEVRMSNVVARVVE